MPLRQNGHPVLYEIDTRQWLAGLPARGGRRRTLGEVPEEELDRLADLGIDRVWMMGVWRTGDLGQGIARSVPGLLAEYERALPGFTLDDVTGSPYAIAEHVVDPALGGPEALADLRRRLADRGIGLVLDFVVNHTGIDHPWVRERPELFVAGSEADLVRAPGDYFTVDAVSGRRILAHGRDPNFPGWTDTAQLDLRREETRAVLGEVMADLAGRCDGARCDMAILALEPVLARVWGRLEGSPELGEAWPGLLAAARERHPRFLFLAESYWGLEGRLLELGFDYAYDKVLYDRLLSGGAAAVRERLATTEPGLQPHLARFLENHDEVRAAAALPWDRHRAAAVVAFTVPGMVLLHEGQVEGRRTRVPIQLARRPDEVPDPEVVRFYRRLLSAIDDPVIDGGVWRLLPVAPAWDGNPTWESFLAWAWESERGGIRLVVVNFSSEPGQCYVRLARPGIAEEGVVLRDLLSDARYLRDGADLAGEGLYLDLPAYAGHLFEVTLKRRA